MTDQNRQRPSVPGTRKREGAKNLPDILIATWNVRTLNSDYKLQQLVNEMKKFEIKILGIFETHWNNKTPEAFEFKNCVVIQSRRKDNIKRQGVAILVEKEFAECISSYECIAERLMSVSFDTPDGTIIIFQIYAPDSYNDEAQEEFYDDL